MQYENMLDMDRSADMSTVILNKEFVREKRWVGRLGGCGRRKLDKLITGVTLTAAARHRVLLS